MTLVGSGSAAERSRPYNQFRSSSRLDAMKDKGTRQKAMPGPAWLGGPSRPAGDILATISTESRLPDPSPVRKARLCRTASREVSESSSVGP